MESLFGIIPAGGRGSRLAPYPGPKELFPIGWQPYSSNGEVHRRPKVISQYVLEGMVQAGAARVLIVVGEHKDSILRYYGSGTRFRTHIAYLFQDEAAGMVQAIDLAYPWSCNGRVLFGMPDTIVHPPDAFAQLLERHRAHPADITLGLFSTTRPEKFGMVEVAADGRITAHIDKPKETHLQSMWGCAIWEPSFSELIHEVNARGPRPSGRPELVLGDVFDEALARGMRVLGHRFEDGFYLDIGTYDEIVEAQIKISEVQK